MIHDVNIQGLFSTFDLNYDFTGDSSTGLSKILGIHYLIS